MPLLISASHLGGGSGAVGQDFVVLLDVDDRGISGGSSNAIDDSGRVGEGDGTEVGKGNQLAGGVTLLKVLHDPLGVILAERAIGHAGESLLDRGTGGKVLDGGSAASLACRDHGHLDRVTRRDGDAREVVYIMGSTSLSTDPVGEHVMTYKSSRDTTHTKHRSSRWNPRHTSRCQSAR